jgi:histidinol dehydrogenase
VRVERLSVEDVRRAGGPAGLVAHLRRLISSPTALLDAVREIVRQVREEGDAAVLRLTRAHDTAGAEPLPLRVAPQELDDAIKRLPLDVVAGLQVAIVNVAEVAHAAVSEEPTRVTLSQGQQVTLREVPVSSAAVYVPGGRSPYPSTAVMGVVTARAAGVTDVVVCSPPRRDGQVDLAILGACRLLGVERVYRMGGAHAIAALAFGTETVRKVDVIVGPGNLYVQEAKREVAGLVGIDGYAGPSDLMVVLGEDADPRLVALDLLAQAEHGEGSFVGALSPSVAVLDALERELRGLASDSLDSSFACVLAQSADMREAVEIANEFAPEHLQLVGAEAEALVPQVRSAGCLFVGAAAGTAFGDYVAGSNHILPTAGAARFGSGLSPRHFRRWMAEVRLGEVGGETVRKLAAAGAPLARAEGFEWHALSMEARARSAAVEPAPPVASGAPGPGIEPPPPGSAAMGASSERAVEEN